MMAKRGLLDTSVMIAVETGRSVDYGAMPRQQFICAISLGELHLGIHTASDAESRSARIATLETIAGIQSLSVNAAAAAHWGRLRHRLREAGWHINVNDLWIASVALAHGMPVITQDQDFTILRDLDGPAVVMV
jgi:predicted nucleic acid-binding protein